jgi:hypothetical protein
MAKRIFIIQPSASFPEDTIYQICTTKSRLSLLEIYCRDLYDVVDSRTSLEVAKRRAIKLGAKRPSVI